MEKPKITEYDPEFLWRTLEDESRRAEHWYLECQRLRSELARIRSVLVGLEMEIEV